VVVIEVLAGMAGDAGTEEPNETVADVNSVCR